MIVSNEKLNSLRGPFIPVIVISKFFAKFSHCHKFQRPSSRRLRLITLMGALIILDITKTESHDCFFTDDKQHKGRFCSRRLKLHFIYVGIHCNAKENKKLDIKIDCEQFLFSSKIRGEEHKTSKRTTVTLSDGCNNKLLD